MVKAVGRRLEEPTRAEQVIAGVVKESSDAGIWSQETEAEEDQAGVPIGAGGQCADAIRVVDNQGGRSDSCKSLYKLCTCRVILERSEEEQHLLRAVA